MFSAGPVKPTAGSRRTPSTEVSALSPSTRREPIYAVRVGLGHRALGIVEGDVIVWFWIGPHAEYDHLLRML